MVCKSCSYKFFFDPRKDKLTPSVSLHDNRFTAIINHASANDTYYFTPNQLFSSARHFARESKIGCIIISVVILAAGAVGITAEIIVLLLAAIGYGLTGGARNLLETYISELWAIPVFFGLPPISGPIFVLSLPALIWLLLWTSGARDTLIPWR